MKITEPYVFVSCDEGLYQAENAGCRFVGKLDPCNGGCELMRDGDVRGELSAFKSFVLLRVIASRTMTASDRNLQRSHAVASSTCQRDATSA